MAKIKMHRIVSPIKKQKRLILFDLVILSESCMYSTISCQAIVTPTSSDKLNTEPQGRIR